jgi:hypothetical protein
MELVKKALVERKGDRGLCHSGIEVKHNEEEIRIIWPLRHRNNNFPWL